MKNSRHFQLLGCLLACLSVTQGQDKFIKPLPILDFFVPTGGRDPFSDPLKVNLEQFSSKFGGWGDYNTHPRFASDVNGDGRADIVGFGESGVFVSLAMTDADIAAAPQTLVPPPQLPIRVLFKPPVQWLANHFTRASGWVSQDNFPRFVADVNGDKQADLIGFGRDGVFVALSRGSSFATPAKWSGEFGAETGGWTSFNKFPRALADADGDGKADIVGFSGSGVSVGRSTGSSFAPSVKMISNYAVNAGGWESFNLYPRQVGDVNGDGRADIVGFGAGAVVVSLNQGSSFSEPVTWITAFIENAGGWVSFDQYPRMLADVNKDGKADIVGFGETAVSVALSDGARFLPLTPWSDRLVNAAGWNNFNQAPRVMADFTGDGRSDMVGFSPDGVRAVKNIEGLGFDQLTEERKPAPTESFCWKDNYTRGVGVLGSACANGYEDWGGTCYPKCPAGMSGVGPMCWQDCPAGFADMGVSCVKPKATSSAGFGWQSGDAAFDFDTGSRARCEAVHGAGKCYKSGLIWYPSCPAGFHKVGDLVCSPNCPSGMRDDGAFCAKATKERGVGQGHQCPNGMVSDAGLCYPACNSAYNAAGPVCWGKCGGTFPSECGAGCATSQDTCIANSTVMALETVGALANLASFVWGGPGLPASLKIAAKQAAEHGRKAYRTAKMWQLGEHWTRPYRKRAREASLTFAQTFVANKVLDKRNLFFSGLALNKAISVKLVNMAARESGHVEAEGNIGLTALSLIDPTGIVSAIMTFAKYSSCGVESITPSKSSWDLGNIGTGDGSSQSITIAVNKLTTFRHIGTPGYSNCSITPQSDCVGKTLKPGQSCTVKVKAQTGGASLLSELRIYTDEYDSYPYPVQLTANTGAAAQCQLANVEEAANLTTIAGAWKYGGVNVTISPDGVVAEAPGTMNNNIPPGKITLKDPLLQTYEIDFRGGKAALTLSDTGEILSNNSGGYSMGRIPWHPRCKPGQVLVPDSNLGYTGGTDFNGPQCYYAEEGWNFHYIPGGYGIGSQPTMITASKPCPAGYREDASGRYCLPLWTGRHVWGQTDTETPFLVTDCGIKACPPNYTKTACTCKANSIPNPNFKSVAGQGTPPVN